MSTLKNIDSAFKLMRTSVIIIIVACFTFCGIFYYTSQLSIQKAREKIYVLTNGDALELALSKSPEVNRKAEIKNHINMFHRLFFEFDPDANEILKTINKSLVLIDESGQQMHYSRKEALYYHKIVEGSISSRVKIDSIITDVSSYPYRAKIYAIQKLIRPSNVAYKNLIAVMQLRNVKRTDDNPHGLFIERYNLIDNKTVNEKSRN